MPWLKVVVTAGAGEVDALTQVLVAEGAMAVSTQSADAAPVFEQAPGERSLGILNRLEALFELDLDVRAVRHALAYRPMDVEFVEDTDWQNQWRRFAADEVFADRLWLVDRDRDTGDFAGTVLVMQPGLAFGSGAHPTTAMCLDWLARNPIDDCHVLDYGCGSGILGIAAKLLGAKRVVCIDHDPQALSATCDNARENGLRTDDLKVRLPADQVSGERFDVILANILANPLVDLAPVLMGHLARGGVLVMTGLLIDQADLVTRAYPGLCFESTVAGDWIRLDGRFGTQS